MTAAGPDLIGGRPGLLGLLSQIGHDTASAGEAVITARVAAADLEAAVRLLAAHDGARLADVFASGGNPAADGDPVVLRLVWGLDSDRRYLVTESVIEGERYPALSDIAPAAFAEECEIYEQFGIRPAGTKPLNRVALPPGAGPDFPRLGHPPARPPDEVHAPHVVGGHAFEFPFGPVRQVGVESLYYGLVTSGEEIVDLYMFTWHKHRGVEWRLRGATPREALFHVERTEGLGAVAAAWAFAAAAETALDVEPPGPAMLDPGGRARAGAAVQPRRRHGGAVPVHRAVGRPGGSRDRAGAAAAPERGSVRPPLSVRRRRHRRRAPRPGPVSALRRGLPGAYGELRRAADALLSTNSFVDRLEATGILTREAAQRLGLVGPVARATGLAIDVRADHPAEPYAGLPPKVATGDSGDVLARFQVMLAEAAESVRLIGELLEAGAGPGRAERPDGDTSGPDRSGLGWAESSRGEALAWVALDEGGRITRARLRPAAVRNWRGFDDACRSQNVFTDVPIIEASFWLTVAGTSR